MPHERISVTPRLMAATRHIFLTASNGVRSQRRQKLDHGFELAGFGATHHGHWQSFGVLTYTVFAGLMQSAVELSTSRIPLSDRILPQGLYSCPACMRMIFAHLLPLQKSSLVRKETRQRGASRT